MEVVICRGHTRPVVDIGYSDIAQDSYWFVSACKDGKPMLRNGETGDWVGTFDGHKGAVWGSCLTKDALRAATAAADFSARIWDALTGVTLAVLEHKHIVKGVTFNQDGSFLATGGQEKLVRLFDTATATAVLTLAGHTDSVRSLAFLGADTLVTGGGDGTLRAWDLRSGDCRASLPFGTAIGSFTVTPDGTGVVVASGKSLSVVSVTGGADLSVRAKHTFESGVSCGAISPLSSDIIAAGCEDNRVHVLGPEGKLVLLKGHHGGVHSVAFAPDGRTLASGSEDGTVRLWPKAMLTAP